MAKFLEADSRTVTDQRARLHLSEPNIWDLRGVAIVSGSILIPVREGILYSLTEWKFLRQ
jgi:hypothetical protein